ncbi:hypothetical protein Tco_0508980 [Tanacetum coccineum]
MEYASPGASSEDVGSLCLVLGAGSESALGSGVVWRLKTPRGAAVTVGGMEVRDLEDLPFVGGRVCRGLERMRMGRGRKELSGVLGFLEAVKSHFGESVPRHCSGWSWRCCEWPMKRGEEWGWGWGLGRGLMSRCGVEIGVGGIGRECMRVEWDLCGGGGVEYSSELLGVGGWSVVATGSGSGVALGGGVRCMLSVGRCWGAWAETDGGVGRSRGAVGVWCVNWGEGDVRTPVTLEEEKNLVGVLCKGIIGKCSTYGKIWDNEDVHNLRSVKTEFPAIVFNDTLTSEATLLCEPTVSSLNNDEIDFRISFDESDDEDYTILFDKNSFSYKMIFVNDLKTESENDYEKVNMPLLPSPEPTVSYFNDLDYFKDFEKEFPAIVYNDAQTSKSDLLSEPILNPQHIDEFNLKDETSLSKCDEEEQNILNFNDLSHFNVIYPDELKMDTDNDDNKVDIEHSLRDYLSNHYS